MPQGTLQILFCDRISSRSQFVHSLRLVALRVHNAKEQRGSGFFRTEKDAVPF
jgi:hypothetical protein